MPRVFFDECREKCNDCTLCIFGNPLIQFNRFKLKENRANINIDSILFCNYKHSDHTQNLNLLFPLLCASRMLFFLPFTSRRLCFKNAKPSVTYWELSCTYELVLEFKLHIWKLHVTLNYSSREYHIKMGKNQWVLPVILRNPVYFRNILSAKKIKHATRWSNRLSCGPLKSVISHASVL